jgi:hypothetical protein
MKTINIPAAVNGTPGVYTENVGEPGFSIASATTSFFLQVGNGQSFKASAGAQIGAASGPSVGRVTFSNPSTTAIDVTLGDFNSVITPVPPDLQNISGVTNITNPFEYQWWDTAAGTQSPFAAGQGFALTPTKPYRRVWCYVDAPTFPWPTGGNLESGAEIAFTLGGVLVHWLPAVFKFLTSSQFGFATTPAGSDNANRVLTPSSLFYKNGDASTIFYQVKPFDVYVPADFIALNDITGQLAGNIRALLAVQSSEVPIT